MGVRRLRVAVSRMMDARERGLAPGGEFPEWVERSAELRCGLGRLLF